GKNSLNRLIRCVCGKKIGPDPRNFNQRVSLGRNDLLIRTFPKQMGFSQAQIVQMMETVANDATKRMTVYREFSTEQEYQNRVMTPTY
ncbi:hypothetical protein ABKV53_24195, partial [Enterobacter cloacae]|uniref:hypothetical protein n=1 Tax=Enterobacter cloacae TaxID=550 RepID=UPI0032AECAA8